MLRSMHFNLLVALHPTVENLGLIIGGKLDPHPRPSFGGAQGGDEGLRYFAGATRPQNTTIPLFPPSLGKRGQGGWGSIELPRLILYPFLEFRAKHLIGEPCISWDW